MTDDANANTSNSSASKWVVLLLWLIAFSILGWILSDLPLATISQSIAALTVTDWLFWVALNLSIIALATRRWQILSAALGAPIPFASLLMVRQAGQAVSFLTPGPQFGGEPLQIYFLYRQYAQPLRKTILALGLDRLYELLINFSVLLVGVLFLLAQGSVAANWHSIAFVLLAMVLVIAVLGWLLVKQPRWITNKLHRLEQRWEQHPRLQKIGGHRQTSLTTQEATLPRKSPLVLALLLSLLTWTGLLAELALLLKFMDIPFTLTGFVLIAAGLRLAMLLPLPGGIGTVEASVLWSFQMLALSPSAAIGLIALMRLRDVIVLLAGLLCLRVLQRRAHDEQPS